MKDPYREGLSDSVAMERRPVMAPWSDGPRCQGASPGLEFQGSLAGAPRCHGYMALSFVETHCFPHQLPGSGPELSLLYSAVGPGVFTGQSLPSQSRADCLQGKNSEPSGSLSCVQVGRSVGHLCVYLSHDSPRICHKLFSLRLNSRVVFPWATWQRSYRLR